MEESIISNKPTNKKHKKYKLRLSRRQLIRKSLEITQNSTFNLKNCSRDELRSQSNNRDEEAKKRHKMIMLAYSFQRYKQFKLTKRSKSQNTNTMKNILKPIHKKLVNSNRYEETAKNKIIKCILPNDCYTSASTTNLKKKHKKLVSKTPKINLLFQNKVKKQIRAFTEHRNRITHKTKYQQISKSKKNTTLNIPSLDTSKEENNISVTSKIKSTHQNEDYTQELDFTNKTMDEKSIRIEKGFFVKRKEVLGKIFSCNYAKANTSNLKNMLKEYRQIKSLREVKNKDERVALNYKPLKGHLPTITKKVKNMKKEKFSGFLKL